MIEVGHLRVKMKDSSIYANIAQQLPNASGRIFFYPFTNDLTNYEGNGYELEIPIEGSEISGNHYYDGGILHSNLVFDLTQDWNVEFEYRYVGSMTKTEFGGNSNETLSTDWNHIFAWGSHILGINEDGRNVDSPYWVLPMEGIRPEQSSDNKDCVPFCNLTNISFQEWHKYKIECKEMRTTVYVDGNSYPTNQFAYGPSVGCFYLSGGGYYHSLHCNIKNLLIEGTLSI